MNILDYLFCRYPFDSKRPDVELAESVVEKLTHAPNASLFHNEAKAFLDYVIWRSREKLDSALKTDFVNTSGEWGSDKGVRDPDPDFFGYCGFSQIVFRIGFDKLGA